MEREHDTRWIESPVRATLSSDSGVKHIEGPCVFGHRDGDPSTSSVALADINGELASRCKFVPRCSLRICASGDKRLGGLWTQRSTCMPSHGKTSVRRTEYKARYQHQ